MNKIIAIAAAAVLIFIGIIFFINSEEKIETSKNEPALSEVDNKTTAPNPFAELISAAADGAEVFIIKPKNGATVSSPLTVKFGIRNMLVAKAGDQTEFSGHHHLLINLEELPKLDAPLPATDQIVHFGGAQTETTIELEAGENTLQLLLGNYLHIPHNTPVLSEKISITVE